jgi:hypothetical protein
VRPRSSKTKVWLKCLGLRQSLWSIGSVADDLAVSDLSRIEMHNTFNHLQWSNVDNTVLFAPPTGEQPYPSLDMITGDRDRESCSWLYALGFSLSPD